MCKDTGPFLKEALKSQKSELGSCVLVSVLLGTFLHDGTCCILFRSDFVALLCGEPCEMCRQLSHSSSGRQGAMVVSTALPTLQKGTPEKRLVGLSPTAVPVAQDLCFSPTLHAVLTVLVSVIIDSAAFQLELDTRHDKYERLVKLSRDITIESKRTIFLLHRFTR